VIDRRLFCTWTYRAALPPALRDQVADLDQLLRDLSLSARLSLLLVSPYLSPAGLRAMKSAVAMAAMAGAWVTVITAPLDENERRNRQAIEELTDGDEGRFIERRLRVLVPAPTFDQLIHSKLIVVDGQRGYLGSANFSWHGMESNLELGVCLEASQAAAIAGIFEHLEASGKLVEVPLDKTTSHAT